MKHRFIRLISFLIILPFLFLQISYANPEVFSSQIGLDYVRGGVSLGGGFSQMRASLSRSLGNVLTELNPVTSYSSIMRSVTDGVTQSSSGFSRLIANVLNEATTQLALQGINNVLEKTKLDVFTKALLSTVTTAGVEAFGAAFSQTSFTLSQSSPESLGIRGPPTGLSGIISEIGSAISRVGGLVTHVLKDGAGFIQSLFIQDDGLSPNARILFGTDGTPQEYELPNFNTQTLYSLDSLGQDLYRSDLDGGDYQYLGLDPNTNAVTSSERVGNLSWFDQIKSGWEAWSDFVTTDPTMQSVGGYEVGLSEAFMNAPENFARMPEALANLLFHPIASAQAIGTHIRETYNIITGPNSYESGRAIGNIFGGIEVDLVTGAGLKSIGAALKTLPASGGFTSRLINVLADERGFLRVRNQQRLRPVLLGETMEFRVGPVAQKIGADIFKPRSRNAANWIENNVRWIKEQIATGRKIYDVGRDAERAGLQRSPFYAAERRVLQETGYQRRFIRWVEANGRRYRLYEWAKE